MTELDFPGRAAPVFFERETDSTNTRLKAMAAQAADGTVVAAGRQTVGRGRLGRSFASPEGGVYLSILFSPHSEPSRCLTMTPTTAVAVRQAIRRVCGVSPDIKWPNDLQLGGRKLCGILTESVVSCGEAKIVVGIGINLNTRPEDLPPELRSSACSVFSVTGHITQPKLLIRELVTSLDTMYARWLGDPHCALDEYRSACITPGRRVRRGNICSEALGVDRDFALLVRLDSGEIIPVTSGEVLDA